MAKAAKTSTIWDGYYTTLRLMAQQNKTLQKKNKTTFASGVNEKLQGKLQVKLYFNHFQQTGL